MKTSGQAKRLILISESKELYKSFNRSFETIGNIIWIKKVESLKENFKDNKDIILFVSKDRNEMYRWLWDEIRIDLKAINSIIIMGFHKIASIEDLRDLIFEKMETKQSHLYLQIPFSIEELTNSIYNVKAFPKKKLPYFIKNYCDLKGILEIILTHDLPNRIREGKREKAVSLYKRVKEVLLFVSAKNACEEILAIIDEEIKNVEEQDLEKHGWKFIERAREIANKIKKLDFNE